MGVYTKPHVSLWKLIRQQIWSQEVLDCSSCTSYYQMIGGLFLYKEIYPMFLCEIPYLYIYRLIIKWLAVCVLTKKLPHVSLWNLIPLQIWSQEVLNCISRTSNYQMIGGLCFYKEIYPMFLCKHSYRYKFDHSKYWTVYYALLSQMIGGCVFTKNNGGIYKTPSFFVKTHTATNIWLYIVHFLLSNLDITNDCKYHTIVST